MMHSNDKKTRFSLAYINAVEACAGFDVVEPKVDIDSVDGMCSPDCGPSCCVNSSLSSRLAKLA